jgi:hypothetical protein
MLASFPASMLNQNRADSRIPNRINLISPRSRKLRCHVAVAKLGRLSRDVHFISGLMAHKIPFLVAELGPDVVALAKPTCTPGPLSSILTRPKGSPEHPRAIG